MSNYLAIATVTATLKTILEDKIWERTGRQPSITTLRPDQVEEPTKNLGINIFLYRTAPLHWRSGDLPRKSVGQLIKRPQIALELNYIFSFCGNEASLEPQSLLGLVTSTFHQEAELKQEDIRKTINNSLYQNSLQGSNLDDQVETIKIMPLVLSTEDLSKIWSIFFQTPYLLSVAYQVSAVLVESDDMPIRLPRVKQVAPKVSPNIPRISKIVCQNRELQKIASKSPDAPVYVYADSLIEIHGSNLLGNPDITKIRINEFEAIDINRLIPEEDPRKIRKYLSRDKIIIDLSKFLTEEINVNLKTQEQQLSIYFVNYQDEVTAISNQLNCILVPKITAISTQIAPRNANQLNISVTTIPTIDPAQKAYLLLDRYLNHFSNQEDFEFPTKTLEIRERHENQLSISLLKKPGINSWIYCFNTYSEDNSEKQRENKDFTKVRSGIYFVRLKVDQYETLNPSGDNESMVSLEILE